MLVFIRAKPGGSTSKTRFAISAKIYFSKMKGEKENFLQVVYSLSMFFNFICVHKYYVICCITMH